MCLTDFSFGNVYTYFHHIWQSGNVPSKICFANWRHFLSKIHRKIYITFYLTSNIISIKKNGKVVLFGKSIAKAVYFFAIFYTALPTHFSCQMLITVTIWLKWKSVLIPYMFLLQPKKKERKNVYWHRAYLVCVNVKHCNKNVCFPHING